jgi:2-keto-4-pentenoate hydratase/2-oxohepta-3-ene-1,7-dioic acid hydratase in catechol pathway
VTNQNVTRYVRYSSGNETSYGILEGDTIRQIAGTPFEDPTPTGRTVPVSSAKLLIPVDPDSISKVIAVVENYLKPGEAAPFVPHPFLSPKMQTSLITDGQEIEIPPESHHATHLGGMVIVIGKEGRNVSIEDAPQYVFGVAVGNDVTEAGWLDRSGGANVPDRIIAKACDTWGPIGTEIVTGLDYNDLAIETRVNGRSAASGRTSQMVTNVSKLIHYISHYCTLLPGDLIYTGAPVGDPALAEIKPGDVVEVTLEGVGTLRNPVVAMKEAGIDAWWERLADEARAAAAAAAPAAR